MTAYILSRISTSNKNTFDGMDDKTVRSVKYLMNGKGKFRVRNMSAEGLHAIRRNATYASADEANGWLDFHGRAMTYSQSDDGQYRVWIS